MGYFNKRESTGIFENDNGVYREYKDDTGNGSINSITQALGYHSDEVYSYFVPNGYSDKVSVIILEIFSRNIIFVTTNKSVTFIVTKDIRKAMTGFSFDYEFKPNTIEQILTTGIENESLRIGFLAEVLDIKNTDNYGLFYAKKIKTYLQITEGILTDFQYDDGFSTWARELREVNSTIFNLIVATAKKFRPFDTFLMNKEINLQSEAWGKVPYAARNEFASLHTNDIGSINFYMIMVCHYNQDITEEEFVQINFGRYHWDKSWRGAGRKYNYGRFSFQFDAEGQLLDFAGPSK